MVATVRIERYLIDTLMRDLAGHDARPSAFLLYLYISTRPGHKTKTSLADLARGTGLSKRSIQLSIVWLQRRRLLEVSRTSRTAIPTYAALRPWLHR
jgi:hypothetical protein